ncbi:MAG: DUF421 domain-containing protein [Candidatus Limnocylindria bacterium]
MWNLAVPAWELAFRSAVIYLAMLAALRLFGKREVGQFTLFDLVLILLLANAVQPAMTGPDTSLAGGLVIIATLVVENRLIAFIRSKVPAFDRLLEASPTVIGEDGKWVDAAFRREDLSIDDGERALREHGVASIEEAKLVVLEADGSISVVPKDSSSGGGRRPRRRARIFRSR